MIIHSHTKNQVNISNHSEIKWWQLNICQISKSKGHNSAKKLGPERIVNLICNSSLYIHIPKIKSISPNIANKKVVTTKYLAKFQSPRAITRPKIIGPERNVNLICNSSLYTHIPNIKSIFQSITRKSGDN
jgi:hypothetical protein